MKIFGIGFHKTGTKSLAKALRLLDYSVTGPNGVADTEIASNVFDYMDRLVPQFDAFQDNPWPLIFRQLDNRFPNSKFILTIRNSSNWIHSVVNHFGCNDTPMRQWIYGVGHPEGNEQIYLHRYQQHNEDVLSYFRTRPTDLLVMDIPSGDGWDKLCPFLNQKVPSAPFPHANSAIARNAKTEFLAACRL